MIIGGPPEVGGVACSVLRKGAERMIINFHGAGGHGDIGCRLDYGQ